MKTKKKATRSLTTFESAFIESSSKTGDEKSMKIAKHHYHNRENLKYDSDKKLVEDTHKKIDCCGGSGEGSDDGRCLIVLKWENKND